MKRKGRRADELRPTRLQRGWADFAEGSCLIEQGGTRVLCTASVERRLPEFLRDKRQGWVTAEYSMLPRATPERNPRDSTRGRPNSRSLEISRLIGRALRAAVVLENLPEICITIDCDVLRADGGTRCAAITGGMVALADALRWLQERGLVTKSPLRHLVAAVSVGIVAGEPRLDLCYEEDSQAEADLNVVMTADGRFVEIQGTAERTPFTLQQFEMLRRLAASGIRRLFDLQRCALKGRRQHRE
ncbi:MAG: ribonuclease PH [Planctomycetota bacterium]|nr:ribonuclease PH [Planctomycetota bacterium]